MPLRSLTLLLAYALPFAAGAMEDDAGLARIAGALQGAHGAEQARQRDVLAWVKTVRDRKDAARVCGDAGEVSLADGAMPPSGLPDSLRLSGLLAGICSDGESGARPRPEDIADE